MAGEKTVHANPGPTATPGEHPAPDQHVVVIGVDTTTVRLYEELARAGEHVVVIAVGRRSPEAYPDLLALGAEPIETAQVRETDLRRARVECAKAVVILGADDVGAVSVALLVEEVNPAVRLVIEMGNRSFGDRLADALGECVVLSPAELAAPSFVAAAMAQGGVQTFDIGGRLVVAGPRERVGGEQLAVLGDTTRSGVESLLPTTGDIVLGTTVLGRGAPTDHKTVRTAGFLGAFRYVFDRRVRLVSSCLLALIVISTLYFRLAGGSGWLVALYLALTSSTQTAGLGDLSDANASILVRYGAVVIQALGLVLSAGVTAVIVDLMVTARLDTVTGAVRGRPRHHVVVCGLGRIGTSVAIRLQRRGVPVVAVEQDEAAPGVQRARALKIPVIIARAADPVALERAGIDRADAVLAVTNDDAVNIEIGLVVKGRNPDVRVVTRVFDHDLAARVEKRLRLGATRSVAMLAAPVFVAAALGRRRETVVPVGRRVLLLTHVTVHPGSAACGRPYADITRPGTLQLLAHERSGAGWSWEPPTGVVRSGDRLAVAATRAGLARLLLAARAPTGLPD